MRIAKASVFASLLICLGQALADCPKCDSGLIGNGPVKVVCPWCCGKNEPNSPQGAKGKDASFSDKKPDTSEKVQGKVSHLDSVVRIVSQHGDSASGGSGVVIEHDGKPAVLTAHHVVYEQGRPGTITVIFRDGTKSPATIAKVSDPYDLALLSCEKYGAVAVPVAASPKMGDTLTIAGFGPSPHAFREARGRVVGRGKPMGRGYAADFIDVSTGARQGDSGGPMFNQSGEVAGILWGSSNGTTVGSHSGRLRAFLGGNETASTCPDGRCKQ